MKSERFLETLPHRPYCADELGVTLVRAKPTAIKKKYLQVNPPHLVSYLVFDIDREGAVLSWYDENLPAPYWTSKNQANAHAHVVFRLKIGVCRTEMAHLEPLRYLAAIESAMCERLKSDRGFAGLLTKNPLHDHWQNTFWTDHEYTLDELADYLDLTGHPLRGIESSGLGRNCELFDAGREWAYKAIRDYWAPDYYRQWSEAVRARVEALNAQFSEPLPMSEVKSIAKSIANWTYKHFTPEGFSRSQAHKGAKGGKIGGKVSKGGGRPIGSVDENSLEQKEPWKELGIGRKTYFRNMKDKCDQDQQK